jgi:type IV pilus assembly protein PilB
VIKKMNSEALNEVDLDSLEIDKETVKAIPEETAIKNCLIPFKKTQNKIFIAVEKVIPTETLSQVKFLSGVDVVMYKAQRSQILRAIQNLYGIADAEKAIETLCSEDKNNITDFMNLESESIERAPVVMLTNSIFNLAISKGASDIHIEPSQENGIVRLRIDGILNEILKIPTYIYPLVCTRIKVLSNMDITEKKLPQDGKISYKHLKRNYDFRVSTLPTIFGEKIVIRILYKTERPITLNGLGFSENEINIMIKMLKHSHGLILVTGPTGSGKSTTLYGMLNTLKQKEKNIVTIEDPVEYTISGVNQVNVDIKRKLTFSNGLKCILRQDPDIIMIGEIRDEETAAIAIRAAITGHLVLSTLHTNNARDSIVRLLDMGIPSYLLFDALIGVIAQRLVRKICPHCGYSYKPSKYEMEFMKLKNDSNLMLKKGKGCLYCNGTGYRGRTVIWESIYMDMGNKRKLQEFIKNDTNYCCDINDGETLRNCCIDFIKNGVTSFDELLSNL